MGFSLKKTLKKVAKISTAPARELVNINRKVLDKTGINKAIKKGIGIDLNNISKVTSDAMQLKGSTGSKDFKNAFFDSAKIGLAVAGGTGALSLTQAGAGALLASKIQSGKGASLSDVAGVAGFDTTFGGLDFGGMDLIKSKKQSSTPSLIENNYSDYSGEYIAPEKTNKIDKKVLLIGGGVIALIIMMIIFRGKK